MKILGQSKVKSSTRRLSPNTKVAETSNYDILAIKELEATPDITLTSLGVNHNHRRSRITNSINSHNQVHRNNLEKIC